MAESSEFKRMNYFTGFFTTAEDWRAEQAYHREALKLHNRGLHRPGVMREVGDGLRVRAAGGLTVEVLPGAAIDGAGNEIFLGQPRLLTVPTEGLTAPRVIYVALVYREVETDRVENVQVPGYSGNTRITERPELRIVESPPNNRATLELARIDLQPGVTAIADPADPQAPLGNEIDRRRVPYAGAVGGAECCPSLSVELQARIDQLMDRTWSDFAALATRFPTPLSGDVRHAALTLQMLARLGFMRSDQVLGLLRVLAGVEQVLADELETLYPELEALAAYEELLGALIRLFDALIEENLDLALTRQDEVAEAADRLAMVEIAEPVANAGADRTMTTTGAEGTLALDGSASQAFEGRTIRRYHWSLRESATAPTGNAGADRTIVIAGDEGPVALDASGSQASGGGTIVRYRWDERPE